MAFTYAIATSRGQTRLLVSDTTDSGHTWEDAEVDAALTLASDNVFDAAAILLDTARASFKKLLSIRLFGELSLTVTEQQRELAALANHYREIARCDAAAQLAQLQERISLTGRDNTDHKLTTTVDNSDFSDYSEDQFRRL